MIQHSVDDDGALVLTVEGGSAAAPLREQLLLWMLGQVTAPAAPKALPAPAPAPAVDTEAEEETPAHPAPARPRRPAAKPAGAQRGDDMRARILEAIQKHGPCGPGRIWEELGVRVPVSPQRRAQLKSLVDAGTVTLSGPQTRKVYQVAGAPSAVDERSALERNNARVLEALQELAPCSPKKVCARVGLTRQTLEASFRALEKARRIRLEGNTAARVIFLVEEEE